MKILWLASWYPNPESPFDGDFVQRHARAVSAFVPLTVLYVSQSGIATKSNEEQVLEMQNDSLKEEIIFFSFFRTGISVIDKLFYNWRYYSVYKKRIREYIKQEGVPDLVHVHIPLKAGMVARWILKKWGVPYIVSEQSAHYDKVSSDSFFRKSFIHRNKVAGVFKEAASATNVSSAVGHTLKKIFHLQNVVTVHNVADCNLFYYDNVQSTDEYFRFVHVSTLKESQKNASGILKAIQMLAAKRQDFFFDIVGPAENSFKQKAMEYGLGKIVRFTGELSYTSVANQMRGASAFVLFSRYENFPCVVVEALCCGLPVIATDVGGIREAVDSSNGILIPSGDESALAQAMDTMMETYMKYHRKDISMRSIQKYSFDSIGKQFFHLYQNVIRHR